MQQLNRKIFYVAAPVSGDVTANMERALRWLKWLRHDDPASTYVMPWVAALLSGEDDADPQARERGLVDCETVAMRCDGIVLVGGRISSGMERERQAALFALGSVRDLTHLGAEPPGTHSRFDTTEVG